MKFKMKSALLAAALCIGATSASAQDTNNQGMTGNTQATGTMQMNNNNMQMSGNDLVATATSAGNFTTLARALEAAGLVDALRGNKAMTVFAPTDEAFQKLPAGTLDALLQDQNKLRSILLYHVVPGAVTADKLNDDSLVWTAQGTSFSVQRDAGAVMVNNARVVRPDVTASNGVIHAIDTVLMPGTNVMVKNDFVRPDNRMMNKSMNMDRMNNTTNDSTTNRPGTNN